MSLEKQQYYAQPHNAFWKIMGRLFGAAPELPYDRRLEVLRAHRVAVWDVLAAGERSGSLDSAIVASSIVVNDFGAFFGAHGEIRLVCFNGNKAAELYRRRVLPGLTPAIAALETQLLPSTSPAHASRTFARSSRVGRPCSVSAEAQAATRSGDNAGSSSVTTRPGWLSPSSSRP